MSHFRLPRQQHRQVPAGLHQQGLGGLRHGVSGCFFSLPSGKETCSSAPAASWDLGPLVSVLFASFQDFQFYIQNFTALQLGTIVPPARQATFEYSFIPAEPMGGRPFGLVINLNYKDNSVSARVLGKWISVHRIEQYYNKSVVKLYLWLLSWGKVGFRRVWTWSSFLFVQGNIFQDAVFNQTVTITEREDGLDGETYVCPLFILLGFFLAAVTLIVLPVSPPQHLHVRLPVGSRTARHHRSSSAAGVQKGRKTCVDFFIFLNYQLNILTRVFVRLKTNLRWRFPCRDGARLQRWKWEPPATTAWTSAGFLRKHSTRSVCVTLLSCTICGLVRSCACSCVSRAVVPPQALVLLVFWCRRCCRWLHLWTKTQEFGF